jgi:hypothetical protein
MNERATRLRRLSRLRSTLCFMATCKQTRITGQGNKAVAVHPCVHSFWGTEKLFSPSTLLQLTRRAASPVISHAYHLWPTFADGLQSLQSQGISHVIDEWQYL